MPTEGGESASGPPPQVRRVKVPQQSSEDNSSSSGSKKTFSSRSPQLSEDSEVLSPIDEDAVAVSFDTSHIASTELRSIDAAFQQLALDPGHNVQQLYSQEC
ncbi:hypothetical protein MY4824_010006 [Beauveria thailandica]